MTFDELWLSGIWRRLGKESARRRYEKLSEADKGLMLTAVLEFNLVWRDQRRKNVERGDDPDAFIPHGSTFFGPSLRGSKGWRDYLPEWAESVQAAKEPSEGPLFAPRGSQTSKTSHLHFCEACRPVHQWECPGDRETCYGAACPQLKAAHEIAMSPDVLSLDGFVSRPEFRAAMEHASMPQRREVAPQSDAEKEARLAMLRRQAERLGK